MCYQYNMKNKPQKVLVFTQIYHRAAATYTCYIPIFDIFNNRFLYENYMCVVCVCVLFVLGQTVPICIFDYFIYHLKSNLYS